MTLALGAAALIAWTYLLLGRGMFWLTRERDDQDAPAPALKSWPSVAIIVPARNEADVIARSLGSLVAQDYPGEFRVVLIDDGSTDGTAAAAPRPSDRLEVLNGQRSARGLDRKALGRRPGRGARFSRAAAPDYLLLTDADIAHEPGNPPRSSGARGGRRDLVLTSVMVKLERSTVWRTG